MAKEVCHGCPGVSAAKTYDFVGEELYYEGPPARGDLATNILLGATILWIVRCLIFVVALVLQQTTHF